MINSKYKRIRELRRKGHSYSEIVRQLRVSRRDIRKIAKITKFSREGKKRYFQKVTGIIKPIKNQKQKLTLVKTRIIGNLLFDGSVFRSKKYYYGIMYVNASESLVKQFCKDMENVYGLKPSIFKERGKTLVYRAKNISKPIYLDLLKYTPSYSTSNEIVSIPEEILNGFKRIKLEFLRTFWDNEGSISKDGRLRGYSKSLVIIKQLFEIHEQFGFEGNIYKDRDQGYILSLNKSQDNLNKFYQYKLFTNSIVTHSNFTGLKKMDVVEKFLKNRK